jgi:RNA polymerase sigma factor (sigma-70 family)
MTLSATSKAKLNPANGRHPDEVPFLRLGAARAKLLSPRDEFQLVKRLCHLRERVRRALRSILERADDQNRLDHFDQELSYVQSLPRIPKGIARRIEPILHEYQTIKHTLVLANLPWVTRLARMHHAGTIPQEDLFQEGVCGLLKAIDRFEAERGLRLMTYATWYIREAMQQVRARQAHLVTLSAHDQTLLGQLENHRVLFLHQHERAPATGEIERGIEAKNRALDRLQSATRPTVSLERGGVDGALPVAVEDPIHEIDRQEEVRWALQRLLESLPTRERMIVTRRYGLGGEKPASLETLGDWFNVSKERIRQLQRQAIRRMQEHARTERLPDSMTV